MVAARWVAGSRAASSSGLTAHIRFSCSPPQAAKVKLGAIKSIVDSNFAPAPVPLAFANTAGERWGRQLGWAATRSCNLACFAAQNRP